MGTETFFGFTNNKLIPFDLLTELKFI